MQNKISYKVIFTRTENGQEIVAKVLKFGAIAPEVHWGRKAFILDWQHPLYLNRLQRVYVVNLETGTQLVPAGQGTPMRPEELDVIVGTKIIREITHSVAQDFKEKLVWLIIGAIIGLLAGALIMMLVMQSKIDSMPQGFYNTTQITLSLIRSLGGR